MSSPHNRVVVAYVPVPHSGYLNFFRNHKDEVLYIFGKDIISTFPSLVRNLPGDEPEDVQKMLESLNIFSLVKILSKDTISELAAFSSVVLPDEDVSHAVFKEYFSSLEVTFDDSWKLRWHKDAVIKNQDIENTSTISETDFDKTLMKNAFFEARKSSDWWRQVGAMLVKEGKVLVSGYNKHLPSEQNPYVYGDPRSNFSAGEHIEASSALHAEIGVLVASAREGVSTEGCDLYVTTFPCPPCAYACAESGIKRLFYSEGYSLIEGESALRSKGIEIIRVISDTQPQSE